VRSLSPSAAAAATVVLALALSGCASADKQPAASTPAAAAATGSAHPAAADAVPARPIGSGLWQAMRIDAEESAPTALYIYDGAAFTKLKAPAKASFDLKVLLTDRHSGVPIPYATVLAKITRKGRTVFRGREEPTLPGSGISDYESNVSLPAAGTYTLALTVRSPLAGRHLEYSRIWPYGASHRLVLSFRYPPAA
jgi:hypothetical protein